MFKLELIFCVMFLLHVRCHGQVNDGDSRLFGGKDDAGIVQIYQDTEWKTMCGVNFTDKEANVICRRQGFSDGIRLPLAAYGEYPDVVAYPEVLRGCQTGQETSLLDCMFDANAECNPTSFAYASVKCFNVLQEPSETIRLDNGNTSEAGYFSSISVYRFGIWGKVCWEFWDDKAASVACRELGYAGGKASFFDKDQTVPFLVGNVYCHGNESRLSDCAESEQYCYQDRVAGVFCYKTEEPQFSLVGGAAYYGKVVLSVDGVEGVICKSGLTYHTAEVICREIGDYHSGYDMFESFPAPSITNVFLEGVDCTGDERSFWECPNKGWGAVSSSCQNPDNGFNIYCYSKVGIFSTDLETKDLFIGRVELWDERWYAVCAELFTQSMAALVCSEFGYPVAEILSPDALGRKLGSTSVNSISCGGTEASLSECNFTVGSCQNYDEHAYVLCRQENVTSDDKITLSSNSYHGRVYVERYGKRGTICRHGWDDKDATVTCKMMGYNYGEVLGTRAYVTRYRPVWMADVSCYGDETDLRHCNYSTVVDWDCVSDLVAAGVLCSNRQPPDPPVRLVDGTSQDQGRVEVYHEQIGWGTICDMDWSDIDADVFCKQLGFPEGKSQLGAYTGTAQGPVLLNGIKCSGNETSLLQCPNNGWDSVSSSCDHSRDAGAFCYKHVMLTPSPFSGAVLIHKGTYRLICADGFDQTAADIVCKELGYHYSRNLCCSAAGPQRYTIGVSNVRCTGTEVSLRHCEHEESDTSCVSGNYAAVICSTYDGPFQEVEVLEDGKVRLTYFIHEGYLCAEDFTDHDAKVVCGERGFSYGYGIKVSAQGIEHSVRWLRDMQCIGNESTIMDCGNIQWGQIGVCDWSMVAGALCTQDEAGLDFEVRLVNGTDTAGRVEIKINNEWGTICGNDFTKSEAVVICGQLGYFDGVALAAGSHGGGSGEITLKGARCSGKEKTLKDCVWLGYKQSSGLCDHSKDAAVKCYYNLRLAGSTTVNYGRLEVYNNEDADWLAVCDYGRNINDANVLCRMLGYHMGLFQKSSPLGPTDQPITISEVTCISQSTCTFKRGECSSGKYVALYCSESVITTESIRVRLPLSSYYGPVEINRFGLWGAVCDLDFDDKDAAVVCKQLSFKSGYALSTYATDGFPTIQGGVDCIDSEASIADCDRAAFFEDHGCYDRDTVAGVFCFDDDGVEHTETDIDPTTGLMETRIEIESAGNKLYIALEGFTDIDASVYCKTLGFGGGRIYRTGSGSYGVMRVSCHGDELSIWQCPAVWDQEKTQDREGALAGVSCFKTVSLLGGNFLSHGILYSVRGFDHGPVCAEGFDETDAGVACRNLGFDAGLVLCCSPYGTADHPPSMTNVSCNGDEDKFTDCFHSNVSDAEVAACKVNYAAVACYNGEKTSEYSVRLPTDDTYSGVVILQYLGIDGRICSDSWDNKDADVVCNELGYFKGVAQIHQREDIRLPVINGPYWMTNINCNGTEDKLGDCDSTELGTVTECESRHYAGVVCYDKEGLFYRLAGSDEPRYGRVEVSIKGEWRSLCDLYWGNKEAHVMCKMVGFRAGEAYHGSYKDTGQGPVWDANFQCNGSELGLNDCPFTSWEIATSQHCAVHQNDAGAFCYTSVKLSTGVGRMTDRGGVLLYWNDKWSTICSDGFNDTSARVVCQELGFEDGQAQCCSAYGDLQQFRHLDTHKVKCSGDEIDVTSCLVEEVCDTDQYASVICYGFLLTTETVTAAPKEEKFNATPIIIAVVLFIVLVIIALIVTYCIMKRRKQLKLERSKEGFDKRIVSETSDRSIVAQNPMHGIGTPEISRVQYRNSDGQERADISPAYLNPYYSAVSAETVGRQEPVDKGGIQAVIKQEPVQTGNNRTVINVNPHQYERLSPSRSGQNPYDNISESNRYEASIQSKPYDMIRSSGHKENDFHSTLVEQPHVSSPNATVNEQRWPDLESGHMEQ